jgi:2-iminobutanoate/2-iminopropanoate deaminase
MKKVLLFFMLILFFTGCSKQTDVREVISSTAAPAAIGPYSQAVRSGNTLYLSGQLGLDPVTGKMAGQDFETQAHQAIKNQKAILEAAGFSLKDVVQCQVFVADINNYPVFNTIYKEYFTGDFPARAVLEVSRIPANGLIEIMMTAVHRN